MAILIAFGVVLAIGPHTSSAQTEQEVRITWLPERPVQGTLFRVRVGPLGNDAQIAGKVAGEPLHFSQSGTGWEALAAAPLDQGSRLEVTVEIVRGAKVDAVHARVPIAKGTYALEKLSVAPQFGTAPDSALQARINRERERALAVSRASHATPRLWQEVQKPTDTRITSGFGSGREFNGQVQSRHTGTDFAGAVGAPVRAAARCGRAG